MTITINEKKEITELVNSLLETQRHNDAINDSGCCDGYDEHECPRIKHLRTKYLIDENPKEIINEPSEEFFKV